MQSDFLDALMEKTVLPSFSSMGPAIRRRRHDWSPLESCNLAGKVVVLTGGTSGIGQEAARLYATLGATLVLLARDESKVRHQVEQLRTSSGNDDILWFIADLGVREQVLQVAAELAENYPYIDVLVHNAGALFNERQHTADGADLSVELMVATPFLLTARLLPQLGNHRADDGKQPRRGPGRVITMSSGGMYTQGLHVEQLAMSDADYSGVRQYARAKRAQVILNEMWAERVAPSEVVFHALHPGWVDTPGISDALPGFVRLLRPLGLLRSPREGADTLVWLSAASEAAACSGRFWHDRAVRSIDMSDSTRQADTPDRRAALWHWCENRTGEIVMPGTRPPHVAESPVFQQPEK
ncbi:SDR family NAD(P)-dependent oxidoreductase [Granulosicoccus sp. 3-233]|uniref:SDR family NAD(P)-dependent oxidoreductase n=1 Tax=Granulosicoccus sp. 3-233 TaxID=3417969 RepID=UPI003D34548B